MALGPKAMGEAIVANLKAKTGKNLEQWKMEIRRSGSNDPAAARRWLRQKGLGQFQALAVCERYFSGDPYADERSLVETHFHGHPAQRALYDAAVEALGALGCTAHPCRGYLPVYRDAKILVSFKATSRGLYAALNLTDKARWPRRVPHKPSLGGTARLKDGIYLLDTNDVARLVDDLRPQ